MCFCCSVNFAFNTDTHKHSFSLPMSVQKTLHKYLRYLHDTYTFGYTYQKKIPGDGDRLLVSVKKKGRQTCIHEMK